MPRIDEIRIGLDRTRRYRIEADAIAGQPLSDREQITHDASQKLADRRVLVTLTSSRFVSPDHGESSNYRTPAAIRQTIR